jgi:mannose-6-phosphate isomerase-like protein (cupin superfamily)
MKAYIADIEHQTEANRDFRRVLYTGSRMQLVLMAVEPGEELGEEVHEDTDQFFRVEEGTGEIVLEGHATPIEEDMAIIVPAGARHNVRNTGRKPLKFYTLYSPPEHPDGTVHRTKADAKKAGHH